MTEKRHIVLVVNYETMGGMGESDAIEEGLREIIENPENPTKFDVDFLRGDTSLAKTLMDERETGVSSRCEEN